MARSFVCELRSQTLTLSPDGDWRPHTTRAGLRVFYTTSAARSSSRAGPDLPHG